MREGNRLWFGLGFYAGEGLQGVGGLGYFDLDSGAFGLLRHPALLDCSSVELEVTAQRFLVLTSAQHELVTAPCNGLVEIDRATLASTLNLPPPTVGVVDDKDDQLNEDERRESVRYQPSGIGLAKRFAGWRKEKGPGMGDGKALGSAQLDRLMLDGAQFEAGWLRAAADRGELKYRQRCKVSASRRDAECDSPVDLAAMRATRRHSQDTPKLYLEGWMVGLLDYMPRYRCETSWQQLGAYSFFNVVPRGLGLLAGRVQGAVADEGGTGRAVVVIDGESAPTATVEAHGASLAGELWSWKLSGFRVANVRCGDPFGRYSGPAFVETTIELQVRELDQLYAPQTPVPSR